VKAPPDYRSDQLFKSNLTFGVFLKCSLKNQSFLRRVDELFKSNLTFCVVCVFVSVFLRLVVDSQSTQRQILKNTVYTLFWVQNNFVWR
jgi:hypothetical protein